MWLFLATFAWVVVAAFGCIYTLRAILNDCYDTVALGCYNPVLGFVTSKTPPGSYFQTSVTQRLRSWLLCQHCTHIMTTLRNIIIECQDLPKRPTKIIQKPRSRRTQPKSSNAVMILKNPKRPSSRRLPQSQNERSCTLKLKRAVCLLWGSCLDGVQNNLNLTQH